MTKTAEYVIRYAPCLGRRRPSRSVLEGFSVFNFKTPTAILKIMLQAKSETLSNIVLAPVDGVRSTVLVDCVRLAHRAERASGGAAAIYAGADHTANFAVLFTGALLGSRLGALAMIAYLAQGAVGLPYFQPGHGGIHYLLFSPTSGYLLAYPAAAFVTGWLAERGWDRHFIFAVAALALGNALILICGWSWFAIWSGSTCSGF
ncbi:MAG: biotin transporter BioY [Pyrinomonadaceae bacterium]